MKNVFFRTAFLVLAAAAAAAPVLADTLDRQIDVTKSTAKFSVTHIWVEHVSGTLPIESGSVTLTPGSLIPQHATAVLDATKIYTDDPDRNASLMSPDFFDSKKYPTWTFESTSITPKGAGTFEMDGNLTIHGVTQPEKLTVTVTGDAGDPVYHATGEIDRHAFGMATTRLDPTIGGTADITLDVKLK